jgi:hypothetical protein
MGEVSLAERLQAIRLERVGRFGTDSSDAPVPLYQYTRMSTLEPVLKHRRMWATEGHFLNDTTELRYAAHLAADYVRAWGVLGAPWLAEPVATAIDNDREARRYLVFVASFSTEWDSLSQWRAYADNGGGLALGFDLSTFSDAPIADGLTRGIVAQCIYKVERHKEAMLTCIAPQLEEAVKEGEASQRDVVVATSQSILITLGELGLVLKNPGFHEEREWRIILAGKDTGVSKAIQFRPTPFGPAPFVEVPLAQPLPLREVILGPKTDGVAERSIRVMLDRYECTAVVRRSKVSYR